MTAVGWLLAGASPHQAIVTAIAVLIITLLCALPVSLLYLHLGDLPMTPVHVFLKAGAMASAA